MTAQIIPFRTQYKRWQHPLYPPDMWHHAMVSQHGNEAHAESMLGHCVSVMKKMGLRNRMDLVNDREFVSKTLGFGIRR